MITLNFLKVDLKERRATPQGDALLFTKQNRQLQLPTSGHRQTDGEALGSSAGKRRGFVTPSANARKSSTQGPPMR